MGIEWNLMGYHLENWYIYIYIYTVIMYNYNMDNNRYIYIMVVKWGFNRILIQDTDTCFPSLISMREAFTTRLRRDGAILQWDHAEQLGQKRAPAVIKRGWLEIPIFTEVKVGFPGNNDIQTSIEILTSIYISWLAGYKYYRWRLRRGNIIELITGGSQLNLSDRNTILGWSFLLNWESQKNIDWWMVPNFWLCTICGYIYIYIYGRSQRCLLAYIYIHGYMMIYDDICVD